MITLTRRAAQQIRNVLGAWGVPNDMVLRVRRNGRGFLLQFDTREPQDVTVTDGDRVLLVLEPRVADELDGRTLDTHGEPAGALLTFDDREVGVV